MDKLTFEEYREIVLKAYEYMYCEVNCHADYQVNLNLVDEMTVDNFVNFVISEKSDNELHYILNFIESSFNFYVKSMQSGEKHYRYGLKSIKIAWIVGKSAIKRHENFRANYPSLPKFLRFVRTKIKTDLWSKFGQETGVGNVDKLTIDKYIELNDREESHKRKMYSTPTTLEHCISTTFLYNHKSNLCVFCDFRPDCKNKLKEFYPTIYRKRGYE